MNPGPWMHEGPAGGDRLAGSPPSAESEGDRDAAPGGTPPTGAPRPVVVAGIIIAILAAVLLAVLHLTGAMGPGVH